MNESEHIYLNNYYYGKRGKRTGIKAYRTGDEHKMKELCVGDLIGFAEGKNAFAGVIIENPRENQPQKNRYGIIGWIHKGLDLNNLTFIKSYEDVPIEILKTLHDKNFEYKNKEA